MGRKNAITLSFWSCSCRDNRSALAPSGSSVLPNVMREDERQEQAHTHHDVIVRVVRWAPSILVAVWAVEYPPVLPERPGEPVCGSDWWRRCRARERSHTHVNAGIRADEVCHGQRALGEGVLTISPDLLPQSDLGTPRVRVPTFPIIARPRPPFGAHSSFATRSSLFARIALQSVVTLWPWLFVSVCGGER